MAPLIAHAMPLHSAGRGRAALYGSTLHAVLFAVILLWMGAPAFPQGQPQGQLQGQGPAPSQPAAAPQAAAPALPGDAPAPEARKPDRKPDNMFDAFGRWWDRSAAELKQSIEENNAKWRQSVDENNNKWRQGVEEQNARWRELNNRNEKAAKDAAAASRDAAEAFKNLSNTRLVEGRQVCEISTNGAPDCQTAAEVFCKSKGFTTGKSADITTTRKCSMRSLFDRASRECKDETVMIKAACQ